MQIDAGVRASEVTNWTPISQRPGPIDQLRTGPVSIAAAWTAPRGLAAGPLSMGDVTGLAPVSLQERELAALLCSAALLGANSSPVRDQSGCHAKFTQLWEQKKDEGENGKSQLRQIRTRPRAFVS